MIELHQFAYIRGFNVSPFCLKAETYLKLAGLPFRSVPDMPFKGPKGKLPFIVDDGETIADSAEIIAYLEQKYGALGDPLPPRRLAELHLLRRALEESLCFVMVHERWMLEENWQKLHGVMKSRLPIPLRWIIPGLIRRKVRRDLKGQGYGRHELALVRQRGIEDIAAASVMLGDAPFLGGDKPCAFDASLYAVIANQYQSGFAGPLAEAVKNHANLTAFCDRIAALIKD
jgi:glutathione S-transferase